MCQCKAEIGHERASLFQLKILRDNAVIPKAATEMSSGYDLCAAIDEPVTINPGEKSVLIGTGVAVMINHRGLAGFILPRSGKGHKLGLVMGNGTGLIDPDYQGELFISACVRPGHDPVTINPGESIAQIVFMPVAHVDVAGGFTIVNEFHTDTTRGTGGFGSTDKG